MSEQEKKWEAHPPVSRGRLEEDLAERRVETKYSLVTINYTVFILKIISGISNNIRRILCKKRECISGELKDN